MKKQIVNIINFIRGIEPRENVDLLAPVKLQIGLLQKYNLPGTFLLQYDALINPTFTDLLKEPCSAGKIEVGAWLEVMKPLVEDAGIVWRGRKGFDWDWHSDVGFTVGYSTNERRKIIDTFMERFFGEFGFYPKSVGSWIIDAVSLDYMAEKYNVEASCNCKDQWGTDGYTLWGGYYGQAYYPSKNNAYIPANTLENQIPIPIFKMLGSDPVYQYDAGLALDKGHTEWQSVITLEPVYKGDSGGGGVPKWVDWYFKENFNGLCINFGYTQAGQENSFGYDAMKDGLCYQIEQISNMQKQNIVEVMTLRESGRWFKENFETTPPTAITALSDWKDNDLKSIWFNSKKYRINVYADGDRFWIRDWHVFDENYKECYIDNVCTEHVLQYDNLPLIDGNRWSKNYIRAGIYPVTEQGETITFDDITVDDANQSIVTKFTTEHGEFSITCLESCIQMSYPQKPFYLRFESACTLPVTRVNDKTADFTYNDHPYSIQIEKGTFQYDENKGIFNIISDACGMISIEI